MACSYQWSRLPSSCACGTKFNIEHALNCHRGGFVIIRHNALRDFLADAIKSTQNDVEVEPQLQPLDNEQFQHHSTLVGDNARPDIRARGFYRAGQNTYFDVQVLNPNSDTYMKISTAKVYERAEQEKMRAYIVQREDFKIGKRILCTSDIFHHWRHGKNVKHIY